MNYQIIPGIHKPDNIVHIFMKSFIFVLYCEVYFC